MSIIKLVDFKGGSHQHQPTLKDIRNNSVPNNYSIRYVASPAKSYLVNPKEGEIDYTMAEKNFDKWFKKVSKQKIIKHRV